MVTNPCCMPLKVGVQIVTHLSMALAVAVGCMGIRLISISSEVTNNPALQYQQQQQQQEYNLRSQFRDEILWKSYLKETRGFKGGIPPDNDEEREEESDQADIFLQTLRTFSSANNNKVPHPDLKEYAKVSLICGLMAVCAVFFQFLTSTILLCFINREGKASSQIWVAVNLSVLFCLSTCLTLFLCSNLRLPIYAFDEKLFLSLLTLDTLLSIYFLWVVLAFI